MRVLVLIAALAAVGVAPGTQRPPDSPAGTRLERHSWLAAEKLLTADTVIVIPVGRWGTISDFNPQTGGK